MPRPAPVCSFAIGLIAACLLLPLGVRPAPAAPLSAHAAASPVTAGQGRPAARPTLGTTDAAILEAGRWSVLAGGDEVLSLAMGGDGLLWAGTEGGGLLRWRGDGSFEQALPGQGLPPIGTRIFEVVAAPDGSTWLAGSLGLARWQDGRWRAYGPAEGLPPGPYTALAFAPDGRAWAGSAHHGLAGLAAGEDHWQPLPTVPFAPEPIDQPAGPGSDEVADLAIDAAGRLWVAHGTGGSGTRPALSMWDSGRGRWKHLAPVAPGAATMAPASDQITALAVDLQRGDLWAASWGRGLLRRRADSGLWSVSEPPDCGKHLRQVAAIDDGIWVACGNALRGAGIARLRGDAWERWLATEGQPLLASVSSFAALDQQLWLGLNGKPGSGGYLVTDRAAPDPPSATPLSSGPALPPANAVTALLEDSDGALWVGTRGAGLLRRGPEGGWTTYTQASTGGRLPGDTITDLALGASQLWIACTKTQYQGRGYTDGGLGQLDLLSGNWQPARRPGKGGLPDGELSSLALDDLGRLWIGIGAATGGPAAGDVSFAGDGLVLLDSADGSLRGFDQGPGQPGLVGSTVLDLAWQPEGQLWLAAAYDSYSSSGRSVGGGVSRRQEDRWRGWKVGEEGLFGWSGQGRGGGSFDLVSGDFRSIHADADGEVLAGTWAVDPSRPDDVITRWPLVDGVINRWDGAGWRHQVLPDAGWVTAFAHGDGLLWAGSSRGASLQDLSAVHGLVPRDSAFGLWLSGDQGWEAVDLRPLGLDLPAVSALTTGRDGQSLWVGTESGGILRYQPGELVPSPSEPPPAASATPEAPPSPEPTAEPSLEPSPEPSATPPPDPSPGASIEPTLQPATAEPTPTALPSATPTAASTQPSIAPTATQTAASPEPQGTAQRLDPWRAGMRCYLPRLEQRKKRR